MSHFWVQRQIGLLILVTTVIVADGPKTIFEKCFEFLWKLVNKKVGFPKIILSSYSSNFENFREI